VDEASDVSRNVTFRVDGQALIVLNRGASQMARSNGTNLNRLTLRHLSDTDGGVYIFWAGNSAGYNTLISVYSQVCLHSQITVFHMKIAF
jgi:hypothetical protein